VDVLATSTDVFLVQGGSDLFHNRSDQEKRTQRHCTSRAAARSVAFVLRHTLRHTSNFEAYDNWQVIETVVSAEGIEPSTY
jgi:hypothetical protein